MLGRATSRDVVAGQDGTFALAGLMPGTYVIASSAIDPATRTPWWLRSAMVGGHDVLDHPLEIGAGTADISGAVLTFTDRHTELQGRLTTAAGQPASDLVVVVFPADRAFWRPGARRLRLTRPSTDGEYRFTDLPPGEYLLAALTDADPKEWQQTTFLEQVAAAAVKVTIGDGAKVHQDLRIGR
jgi:hypothetical protein